MPATNNELEVMLARANRDPIHLSRLDTSEATAPGEVIRYDGTRWIPGQAAGGAGITLLTLALISGPLDDFALIAIGGQNVQASVWIPNHATGAAYEVDQTTVMDGGQRKLRIGVTKGVVPGGFVDVVLTGI